MDRTNEYGRLIFHRTPQENQWKRKKTLFQEVGIGFRHVI